jgi:hypothetical protein
MKAVIISFIAIIVVTTGFLIWNSDGQILTPTVETSISPFRVSTTTPLPNSATTNQAPSPTPQPDAATFATPLVVPNGGQIQFPDGLIMTITGITDSRCPEGAQCISAGEIGVEMTIVGGAITTGEALRLGSMTATTKTVGPYTIALITATPYTLTVTVDKAE